tara:strand:- start:157 stop:1359 length:1203 start_codon:yes stop_codon:yes gene_type:complete
MINKSSKYGLPKKVEFCSKCVMSNQKPNSSIEFTSSNSKNKVGINIEKNICDACKYNDIKNEIDWEKREKELLKLLDKYRNKSGAYDVVVPGSGGKDSAYTSHILKYKYGMNPLTVTWAPHLFTDIGTQNFNNWMRIGGLDNLLFTPNGLLHKRLTSLAFQNLLHPFQPFIIGQKLIAPKIAKKFNIPLIMYGENQAEYGNKINENYIPKMDESFFSVKKKKSIFLGGVSLEKLLKTDKFKLNEYDSYIPFGIEILREKKIEFHYLGYYLKWDPQECYYYSYENTGFSPNVERTQGSYSKYSSIDDKIDYFHYYTTLIKFGIGRTTYDASQEIRNNKITRDEGVTLVKKFDQEFPDKYFKEFLDYIDLTETQFWKNINKFRPPHLWVKKKNNYKLKYQVV